MHKRINTRLFVPHTHSKLGNPRFVDTNWEESNTGISNACGKSVDQFIRLRSLLNRL